MLHGFLSFFLFSISFPVFWFCFELFFHCEAGEHLNMLRFQDWRSPNNITNTFCFKGNVFYICFQEKKNKIKNLGNKNPTIVQACSFISIHAWYQQCVSIYTKNKWTIEKKNENRSLEESVAHDLLDAIAEEQIYFHSCIMSVRSDSTF